MHCHCSKTPNPKSVVLEKNLQGVLRGQLKEIFCFTLEKPGEDLESAQLGCANPL
jgi:hypothetical protein